MQVTSVGHSGSLQLQAEPGGGSSEEEHELCLLDREEEGGGAHRQRGGGGEELPAADQLSHGHAGLRTMEEPMF